MSGTPRNDATMIGDERAMEPTRHPNAIPAVRYVPPSEPFPPPPRPMAPPWAQPARTSGAAVASLVCGILGLFTFALAAIPALVLGYSAQRDARRQGRRPESAATVGIVLGWVSVALVVVVFVLAVMWVGSAATRY